MHALFETDDPVRYICEHAYNDHKPGALASLARVQKRVGNIALEILWQSIGMEALLQLFPPDAIGISGSGKKGFIRPLIRTDWSRFDRYALRTKSIHRSKSRSDIDIMNILHSLALYRQRRYLFPNLQCLEWHVSLIHELPNIFLFFSPSLISAEILVFHNLPQGADLSHSQAQALEAPLWSFFDVCKSSLQRLRISFWGNIVLPRRYELPFSTLLEHCRSVVDVTIVPSPALLRALGGVQTLRALTLHVREWENTESSANINTPGVPFPKLQSITLREASSLSFYTDVLTGAHCFARRRMDICCSDSPSPEELEEFSHVAWHPFFSRDLREFSLRSWVAHTQTPLTAFSPLLACDYLGSVDISGPLSLCDADMHRIASAWPWLTTLKLGSDPSLWVTADERVSLLGLDHLSACANLHALELVVDVAEEDVQSSLSFTQSSYGNCPLEICHLGASRIHGRLAIAIACFLAKRFPRLKKITWGEDELNNIDWKEVDNGLIHIRQLLQNIPAPYIEFLKTG